MGRAQIGASNPNAQQFPGQASWIAVSRAGRTSQGLRTESTSRRPSVNGVANALPTSSLRSMPFQGQQPTRRMADPGDPCDTCYDSPAMASIRRASSRRSAANRPLHQAQR